MKIKSFTRDDARNFRSEIEANLASITKKYGVSVEIGTIRFGGPELSAKITFKTSAADELESNQAVRFLAMYGLKLDDTIRHGKKVYSIVGYSPRSRKFPVEIQETSGKRVRATIEYCLQYLVK